MTPVSSLDAIENFGKHSLDANQRLPTADGPPLHQAYEKYRYPMKVHLRGLANIPHSAPSVRSQKQNSYFPSVSLNFKEKHAEEKVKKDSITQAAASRFGGIVIDDDESVSLEDELHNLHVTEMLNKLNKRGIYLLFFSKLYIASRM